MHRFNSRLIVCAAAILSLAIVSRISSAAPSSQPASAPASGPASKPLIASGQKIVFMGDSITAAGAKPNGYASLVVAGLKANGVEVKMFCQSGSGANSNNMMTSPSLFNGALERKPDWLTISCGVNDAKSDGNACPLEKYKANITTMVEKAQATNVKVMILTTTAWECHKDYAAARKGIQERNELLAPYNDFLRSLAKEKGCVLADINAEFQEILKAEFKPAGGLTENDGCHPNANGHRTMAIVILKTLGLNDAQLEKAKQAWPAADAAKPTGTETKP